MKATAFILISLIAGSFASPFSVAFGKDRVQVASNERIVTGQIVQAIEDIAQQIRDAGLDPFTLDLVVDYQLPVPVIFSANVIIDNLLFTGLSNIVVNSINYSLLQNRLTFTISLPSITLSIGSSEIKTVVFGEQYSGAVDGRVSINGITLIGDIRVTVGIISGISIRSLSLNFRLGGIESALDIELLGRNLSDRVNTLLGDTIPTTLNNFQSEIDELIVTIVWDLINDILNRSPIFANALVTSY